MESTLRTTFLLGLLTVLIVAMGQLVGGTHGMFLAFMFAAMMNLGSYWFSDKIVLTMYGARPIGENEAPELFSIVRELAYNAGIPMPRLYLISTDTPNAFATGRTPNMPS